MTVLFWIAVSLGTVLLLALGVVGGALVSPIRVEGRAGTEGAAGRARWGVFGVEMDPAEDGFVLRWLGLRVVRTSWRRGPRAVDPDTKAKATSEGAVRGRRAGRQLPIAAYRRLARIGWRELRRVVRHVHVDRLRLEAVVASDDPALAGEVYGFGCAALGVVRSRWPHADVHLGVDFSATEPRGVAEGALRLRPVRLVRSAARVGWAYWRERRRSRRRS